MKMIIQKLFKKISHILNTRQQNKELIEMCNEFAGWLESVQIDYRNGNVAPNGMDEGHELGRRGHRELIKKYEALMARIGVKTNLISFCDEEDYLNNDESLF